MIAPRTLIAALLFCTPALAHNALAARQSGTPPAPACIKPVINPPAGPLDRFTVTGTTYAPCDLFDIVVDGYAAGLGNSNGPMTPGSPMPFSYEIDTVTEAGTYLVKIRSFDILDNYREAVSDEVAFTFNGYNWN